LIEQFHASESDELDALYVDSQVVAHADALALLESLAETADAEALQQLIATLIPAVESHHEAAVALKEQIE
jgi:predicted outer membrane protein